MTVAFRVSCTALALAMIDAIGAPDRIWPQPRQSLRVASDSTLVKAGSRYGASGLHRLMFGDGYRDIWATPIKTPVLDLASFAGGIRATKTGGGGQTKNLRFAAGNGT